MKKVFSFLLALCFVAPALLAGTVRDIDNSSWVNHTREMQELRKEILSLVTKEGKTESDAENLSCLMAKFEEKQIAWESYLQNVASEGKAAVAPGKGKCLKSDCKADCKKAHMKKCSKGDCKADCKKAHMKKCSKGDCKADCKKAMMKKCSKGDCKADCKKAMMKKCSKGDCKKACKTDCKK